MQLSRVIEGVNKKRVVEYKIRHEEESNKVSDSITLPDTGRESNARTLPRVISEKVGKYKTGITKVTTAKDIQLSVGAFPLSSRIRTDPR